MGLIRNNFNTGEMSPYLRYRTDLSKYASGCARLENFLVMPWGGVENRPGTEFIATAKYAARAVRLIPFQFNIEQTYIIEAGDGYLRFYMDGGRILDSSNNIYEISSPYAAADDLFQLRYCQSADTLFLVHPKYPPYKLTRSGHAAWTITELDLDGGPFQDENDTDTTVAASATAVGSTATVTASAEIFKSAMVGELFEIVHPREHTLLSKKFTANATDTNTLTVKGNWTVSTTGGWCGTLCLQRSFNGGTTWCDYRTWSSDDDTNVDATGYEEDKDVLYRFVMTNWSTPSSSLSYSCLAQISCDDYWVYGIVRLTAYTSATVMTGMVIREIGSTDATEDWAYGAFSDRCGYPSTVCFYQDRLIFGRTTEQPQSVWTSRTSDYTDFLAGAGDEADDPMTFTIRAQQVNAINWLATRTSGKALMIGTAAAEGTLGPTDDSKALSPDNREYQEKCLYGAAALDCIRVADVTLFLERGGEYLRELAYNWESDGYLAQNLTELAEHVLRGGVVDSSYQQLPYPVVWFVRADGVLVSFTYERLQNVTAWARHTTAGTFLSVATIATDDANEVWVAVERNGVRMIERFKPRRTVTCAADGWFLDSAIQTTFDSAVGKITSGLDHLNGRTDVCAMVDGTLVKNLTVSGGAVDFGNVSGKTVLVGLPYTSTLETMPLEADTQQGSTLQNFKRISGVTLKFYRSLGGTVSTAVNGAVSTSAALITRTADMNMDAPPDLVTGENRISLPGGSGTEVTLTVTQSEPLPLTLLAALVNYSVQGER